MFPEGGAVKRYRIHLSLRSEFRPILEPEPHILQAMNGNQVHHRVPEDGVKLGNHTFLLHQVGDELLYGFPTAGPVSDLSSDRF